MLSWGTECAVLFWVGLPGVVWEPWWNSSSAVMLWGGVWGLKVVLWGLRVVLWGFEVAISCGVGCRNCAELG